jgi:predicted DNA-binding transcriptional regulator AlpA
MAKAKRERIKAPYDPQAEIIRPRHLPHATGLSAVTVWRERRAGRFPQPIQLTPGGAKGWTRDMLSRWRDDRARMGSHTPEAA